MVIGEAVGALSEETRQLEAGIPWAQIKGLRNLLTHQYMHVRLDVILDILRLHVPDLAAAAERLRERLM